MADKFLSLLGMARKANRVVLGLDKAVNTIRGGTAQAAIYACDLSDKTKKELQFAATGRPVRLLNTAYTISQLSAAVGCKTGVVTVTDAGFANRLVSLYNSDTVSI